MNWNLRSHGCYFVCLSCEQQRKDSEISLVSYQEERKLPLAQKQIFPIRGNLTNNIWAIQNLNKSVDINFLKTHFSIRQDTLDLCFRSSALFTEELFRTRSVISGSLLWFP